MEQGIDFTIEPFKPHKHGPRSDKGKLTTTRKLVRSGNNSISKKEVGVNRFSKS